MQLLIFSVTIVKVRRGRGRGRESGRGRTEDIEQLKGEKAEQIEISGSWRTSKSENEDGEERGRCKSERKRYTSK